MHCNNNAWAAVYALWDVGSDLVLIGDHPLLDVRSGLLGDLFVNLDHVLVTELLVETTLHGTVLAGAAPDHCVTELRQQVSMDLHDRRLDSQAVSAPRQEQRVFEIRSLTSSLRVDANQGKLGPDFLEHDVNAEVHMDRDAAVEGVLHHVFDLLNGDSINLVVDVDALDVLPIALDRVDQVLHVVIAIELDVRVVDLVLVHDALHHPLVDLRLLHGRREHNAASFLRLDHDARLFLVQANASVVHFARQFGLLFVGLRGVEHHEHEIRGLAHSNNLFTTTLAVGSAFNDTRQIEQLQLGSIDVELPWNTGERREFVSGRLRLLVRDATKQRGLAH
mmetsp:Transcript_32206/g.39930  ORF Transcript_32206/g.39930 Transcript_32206/m.39930 type:complete len:335 (-) Transcript_32206:232-1236(-)